MIKSIKTGDELSCKITNTSKLYQFASRNFIKYMPFIPSHQRYNISISHERKFIWFRVAKVATRTTFHMFQTANINLDVEQAMFCHYPQGFYKDYFKFAFVRNPWDRLVSCWKNKVIDSNHYGFDQKTLLELQSFNSFVEFVYSLDKKDYDQHIKPQTELIDINNIDYIGRFENLEDDFGKILMRLEIKPTLLERKNASSDQTHYRYFYNDRSKEIAREIYAKDINIFQYEF